MDKEKWDDFGRKVGVSLGTDNISRLAGAEGWDTDQETVLTPCEAGQVVISSVHIQVSACIVLRVSACSMLAVSAFSVLAVSDFSVMKVSVCSVLTVFWVCADSVLGKCWQCFGNGTFYEKTEEVPW